MEEACISLCSDLVISVAMFATHAPAVPQLQTFAVLSAVPDANFTRASCSNLRELLDRGESQGVAAIET